MLLANPSAALANGMEIGFDAGSAVPLQSQNIQLVSEGVTITIGGDVPARAVCEYTLKNLTTQPQTIQMGFLLGSRYSYDARGYADHYRAAGVRVMRWGDTLTAGDLPVRMEEWDSIHWKDLVPFPSDSLPVWEVKFGPSEIVHLTISYATSWSGSCNEERHCRFGITYYARPASLWAGSIEKATITFRFDKFVTLLMACNPDPASCFQVSATPAGFTRFTGGFVWEMRDWEPAEDFNVSVEWTEPK
jgi:hypothetical protein